jgi:hypothetical protein
MVLVPPLYVTKGRPPPVSAPYTRPGNRGPRPTRTIESAIETVVIALLVIVVVGV